LDRVFSLLGVQINHLLLKITDLTLKLCD
jgi:hypothetical protein